MIYPIAGIYKFPERIEKCIESIVIGDHGVFKFAYRRL